MEDQVNPTPPTIDGITPANNRVIGVQPPSSQPESQATPTISSNPEPAGLAQNPMTETVVSQPASVDVSTVGGEAPTNVAPASSDMASPLSSNPAPDVPIHDNSSIHNQQAPHHKKDLPIVAIIAAVIVALGLGVATVILYMKYKSTNSTPKTTTSQQASTTAAATTSDVDRASSQIDTSLGKVDENKDFVASDISNQTLGL